MEILSGKTRFVVFVDLRKKLNSRARDFWLVSCLQQLKLMHDERKSQVICSTKHDGHFLTKLVPYEKDAKKNRIPNKE